MLHYMVIQQDARMEARLDQKNYTASELISIKTKLDLPYYNGSTDGFERAYGSVTVNGLEYQFVMRRIYLDSMELLCLPHTAKMKIEKAGNELNRLSFADQPSQTNKKAATIKISLPDFFQEHKAPAAKIDVVPETVQPSLLVTSLPSKHGLRQEQPPDVPGLSPIS